MSREVRRVQVGWQHPTERNPHWEWQRSIRIGGKSRPESRLLRPFEQFTPLYAGPVSKAREEWHRERHQWEAGEHDSLLFSLRYHSAEGYVNHKGEREEPRPYIVHAEDGETVVRKFFPTTVAELLAVYPYSEYAGDEPNETTHMPDFDVPEDELGWCLYETVSEGTPVTPIFATAAELVEHLATVGIDWDQEPWRREAAEQLVASGHSIASMVLAGGVLYDGAKDIDRIPMANA